MAFNAPADEDRFRPKKLVDMMIYDVDSMMNPESNLLTVLVMERMRWQTLRRHNMVRQAHLWGLIEDVPPTSQLHDAMFLHDGVVGHRR